MGEPTRVVTILPREAIETALAPLRSESTRIVGSMIAGTLVIVIGAVFFVRLSLRALELQESERYLALVRRESAKWRALTESAADMILIVDPKTEAIRERNRMAAEVLGARSLADCLSQPEHAALREALDQAASAPDSPISLGDLHVVGSSGESRAFDPRLVAIDLDGELLVELALRDVTRERAMERQLSIAERLTSLGLLTAGVAHEINNPLEGIGNYLALLARDDVSAEKRVRYVESLKLGFERIRDLVRDLLSFARPGVSQGDADLSQVVARVCKLVGYSKPFAGVEIRLAGLDEPMLVAADPGRMEQVLLNLLINAATAMDGKGAIEISACRLDAAADGGGMIELSVDDEGPGIAEANLARIFDPFFTTTQGKGLVSISYGIIRAHGGRLMASNCRAEARVSP
jgi:signal transduction histidine kinase